LNANVIISCAVTGDDTKVTKSPYCAITPEQIAATAIEAAQAGAAIVHIHVRDPETGTFSMETKYYREVVKRIRESKVDVIVNLTCGMGGYIVVGDGGLKDTPGPGSDFVSQEDRMRHVIDLCHEGLYRPDIATLDCGSLNFGDENRAYVSTPNYLRKGAAICKELGVKPDCIHIEIFNGGESSTPGIAGGVMKTPHRPPLDLETGPLVSFARSGITAHWNPAVYQSMLELAEACDVPVRWSCRTGVCHNCESGLVSGEVAYQPQPLDPPATGNLLICCSRPVGDVVVDL